MSNRITTISQRLACWRAGMERRPYLAAMALGVCLGLLATESSLLLLGLSLQFLPPEQWGNAAVSRLEQLSPEAVFFVAVIHAPLVETVLGQVLPIELAHRLRAPAPVCVLLSGLVFGVGHYINGGLVHGITTFCAGLIFACAYVALRWIGAGPAYVAAASAHAVQNMTLLLVVAPLFSGTS